MGAGPLGGCDNLTQTPVEEPGRASIVFCGISDFCPIQTPGSQTVCDPCTWDSIVERAAGKLLYSDDSLAKCRRKDPAAEKAQELLAELSQAHKDLRFSYCCFWVDWNFEGERRSLDADLDHWEHVLYISNPKGPVKTSRSDSKGGKPSKTSVPSVLVDPRRPVLGAMSHSFVEQKPLSPMPPPLTARLAGNQGSVQRIISWLCQPRQTQNKLELRPRATDLRWYRIHPLGDSDTSDRYFVRPDAGLRGLDGYMRPAGNAEVLDDLPEHEVTQDFRFVRCRNTSKLFRSKSFPDSIERRASLLQDCCRLCCDAPGEVIVLPCRHGGMCEVCCLRSLYSRPVHRGGRNCPLCRTKIVEVLRICRDVGVRSFAYAIKAG
eukprot:TRINITY_DN44934_c0_g1_i1.p1 TRINITY_DN44934_c0_g1~~TRINITY_DN44934_c0_g1_i1.p1  ORF type:complete len:377 (+),score=14.25 TRINITY_DN44934_c0_g1_i1:131-1261(+)